MEPRRRRDRWQLINRTNRKQSHPGGQLVLVAFLLAPSCLPAGLSN